MSSKISAAPQVGVSWNWSCDVDDSDQITAVAAKQNWRRPLRPIRFKSCCHFELSRFAFVSRLFVLLISRRSFAFHLRDRACDETRVSTATRGQIFVLCKPEVSTKWCLLNK